jgi:hypothetical protein
MIKNPIDGVAMDRDEDVVRNVCELLLNAEYSEEREKQADYSFFKYFLDSSVPPNPIADHQPTKMQPMTMLDPQNLCLSKNTHQSGVISAAVQPQLTW